jgi:hypothetical protein
MAADLTAAALALLAVVVDRNGDATIEILRDSIDPVAYSVEASAIVDGLQQLLDLRLVARAEVEKRYAYVATPAGHAVIRAWLHPIGATMESVA